MMMSRMMRMRVPMPMYMTDPFGRRRSPLSVQVPARVEPR
jgi:hypothetical protein